MLHCRVKKYLRNDWYTENVKLKAIENVEIYKEEYAISVLENNNEVEMLVVKAEIANEIINIKGMNINVVLLKDDEKYSVSSRVLELALKQIKQIAQVIMAYKRLNLGKVIKLKK